MNPSESGQMLDWLKIVHLDNLDLSFSSQTSSLSVKGMDIEMEWSFSGNLEFWQPGLVHCIANFVFWFLRTLTFSVMAL